MERKDAEEFTESLGQIFSGSWRQIALAQRLGVPKALGMATEDWVRDRLGGYVKLAVEERREAVKDLTDKGLSTRETADVLGISHQTVANDVKIFTAPPLSPEEQALKSVDQQAEITAKAQRSNIFSHAAKAVYLAEALCNSKGVKIVASALVEHADAFSRQERYTVEQVIEACERLTSLLPDFVKALKKEAVS